MRETLLGTLCANSSRWAAATRGGAAYYEALGTEGGEEGQREARVVFAGGVWGQKAVRRVSLVGREDMSRLEPPPGRGRSGPPPPTPGL